MKKRLAILLVLAMLMMTFTGIMASAEVTSASPSESTNEKTAETFSVSEIVKKYSPVFFDAESASDDSFIVEIEVDRDYSKEDPLAYILSGMVESDGYDAADPYVMLMFIETEDGYKALYNTEARSETNVVKNICFMYAKVTLLNLGSDKHNDVRLVLFRKSDAADLILGENLQITDLRIIAKPYNVFERIRIGLDNVLEAVPDISESAGNG